MSQFHRVLADAKIICSHNVHQNGQLESSNRLVKSPFRKKTGLMNATLQTSGNPQERAIMSVLIVTKALIRHHT